MKSFLFCFGLLLLPLLSITQDIQYREYSYTQLFEMIEAEQDSIFKLKNALIKIDPLRDTLFVAQRVIDIELNLIAKRKEYLVVDKELILEGVHFENLIFIQRETEWQPGYLSKIHFKKNVTIRNCGALHLADCLFDYPVKIGASGFACSEISRVDKELKLQDRIEITNCTFHNGLDFFYNCNFQDEILGTHVTISNNTFHKNNFGENSASLLLTGHRFGTLFMYENEFPEVSLVRIQNSGYGIRIMNNDFGEASVFLGAGAHMQETSFEISENKFQKPVILSVESLMPNSIIDFDQFQKGLISEQGWFLRSKELMFDSTSQINWVTASLNDSLVHSYLHQDRYTQKGMYASELSLQGMLRDHYRAKYNQEAANASYMQLKDLETRRLAFLYSQNPSFSTLFKWQINRFLKVFSNYGTEPSKAIVFSFYVILFFALIYLFFPNSWDSHGRNRLIDRYQFFFKYMKRNAGIHEVYLEEKQEELMTYEEFKSTIEASEKKVPKFFTWSAYPLYRWAISGTQLSAGLLKRLDILQGTWSDLPEDRRWWKGLFLIGAFTIAIIYDLIIKMLNALMLSINTFTTLGFGEIPIKGLPRYLAIIQGFIGWFMLTIFSVSLISQLLN